MRAVTYARYSTEAQSERSIEDQQRNCITLASREGFQLTHHYEDRAITGAVTARPGYRQMLEDAKSRKFDVLIVDDLSRIARDRLEAGRMREQFSFLQIRIIAIADGFDSLQKSHKLHANFKDIFNEMYIDDVADKTHRGLTGKALRGMSTGGKAFGYDHVPIEHPTDKDEYGRPRIIDVRRQVNSEQAGWVLKIFSWHAEGRSYHWIAAELNRNGPPSPRDKGWHHGTIRVILRNRIYIGESIWNQRKKLKNRETGTCKMVTRPKEEWIIRPMPELRIIPQDLWDRVERKLLGNLNHQKAGAGGNHLGNPKYVFSGLLKCGCCGGNFILANLNYYRCHNNKNKGEAICNNSISVRRQIVEERLLENIKGQLHDEEAFQLFRRELVNELKSAKEPDHAPRLKQLNREIVEMVETIKAGVRSPALLNALDEAEREKGEIERKMAKPPQKVENFIPVAMARYAEIVGSLEENLSDDPSVTREYIRELVGDEIKLHPRGNFLEAEIPSGLFYYLARAVGDVCDSSGCGGSFNPQSQNTHRTQFIPLIALK